MEAARWAHSVSSPLVPLLSSSRSSRPFAVSLSFRTVVLSPSLPRDSRSLSLLSPVSPSHQHRLSSSVSVALVRRARTVFPTLSSDSSLVTFIFLSLRLPSPSSRGSLFPSNFFPLHRSLAASRPSRFLFTALLRELLASCSVPRGRPWALFTPVLLRPFVGPHVLCLFPASQRCEPSRSSFFHPDPLSYILFPVLFGRRAASSVPLTQTLFLPFILPRFCLTSLFIPASISRLSFPVTLLLYAEAGKRRATTMADRIGDRGGRRREDGT